MPFAVPPAITTRKPLSCERVKVNWEHPLNRGLIRWFIFNDGAGANISELVNGYGGTAVNAPVWTPTNKGMGLLFVAGSSQRITTSLPFLGLPYTITGWLNPTNITAIQNLIYLNDGSVNNEIRIELAVTTGVAQHNYKQGGGSTYTAASTNAAVAGEWQHLAATNASLVDRKVYLNAGGMGVHTTSCANPTLTTCQFGVARTTYLSGIISNITIWDRALTQSEVMYDYLYPYGTPDNPRLI